MQPSGGVLNKLVNFLVIIRIIYQKSRPSNSSGGGLELFFSVKVDPSKGSVACGGSSRKRQEMAGAIKSSAHAQIKIPGRTLMDSQAQI